MSFKLKKCFIMLIAVVLIAAMASCSDGKNETEIKLSDAQYESLMEQVAKKEIPARFTDYLTEESFAAAELFGVDREEDEGTAYAYLFTEEYVVLKDKAYGMASRSGEAVIKFNIDDQVVKLTEVRWSDDGAGRHEFWMEKNFKTEYMKKVMSYNFVDADGRCPLGEELYDKAEKKLGVPLETENFLEIDTDKGTYEIIRTVNGEDGSFSAETVEKGDLKDLSGNSK